MAGSGLGSLGLWLELRRKRGERLPDLRMPPGNGPLLILRATPAAEVAAREVLQVLQQTVPGLRVLTLGRDAVPDISDDPVAAPQLLAEARPDAVLLLGDDLPAALIHAAGETATPIFLAQTTIREKRGWGLDRTVQARLLGMATYICVADPASRDIALGLGVDADRVQMTGPVTESRDPLPGFENERATLATMLRGRHVWLATALPTAEESAVFRAHQAALLHSHRALLVINPADQAEVNAMADRFAEGGLIVARRSVDEEPLAEVQVLFADDPQELGMWYRLAPLCFMGGTLSGDDAATRHPFEPAALGSAIIHGPHAAHYQTEWQQLAGASASRLVRDPAELAGAVAQLSQPHQVATLAANAWAVSTGGAGVALEIAQAVAPHLKRVPA